MPYQLLADTVLVVHALFIVFAVLGGLLVLRWRQLLWLHLPCVAWVILLIIIIFTAILFRTSAKWVYYGGEK